MLTGHFEELDYERLMRKHSQNPGIDTQNEKFSNNGNINEEDEDTQSVFSFNFLQEDSQNKLSLPDYNLP